MRGNNREWNGLGGRGSGRFALIGGHVVAEAVFDYHQPETFEVFMESIFKLRKDDV